MEDKSSVSKNAAVAIVAAYSQEERVILLAWAQQVMEIRRSNSPVTEKLLRIAKVTNELGLTKPLLRHLLMEARRIAWTDRTTAMRGVIGGAGVGLLASVAAPMAGVAAFGGAIAVPVVLLGASGGALISALIEELTKKP